MKYCLDRGDTNFIALVNADQYESFVDEDWQFDALLQHFSDEMQLGRLLVFQMTEEGIEHSWTIEVRFGASLDGKECFRRVEGYIEVTANTLYIADYDGLTMAAQFRDETIPDASSASRVIELNNGFYQVEVLQFYNADQNEYVGEDQIDMVINLKEVPELGANPDQVIWCSYL
ncbi:hypothetical protein [Paenibacillus radicis (ex Gao et al. 2016)]|uniref:Uncharacterized protein n=1 Tax=Paenibacillus radicis (ex Gao et al. 2016) TaxID=1737354 RepID=A0A917MCI4_9BACL|nr:hypothetical protein [Paenibacillus radicis (ex Gao et al. 2016)]GGG88594.1 hypothetical protein GCM10010918_53950 [Paenibacillus radicis (ex Gao et al. 2016)]